MRIYNNPPGAFLVLVFTVTLLVIALSGADSPTTDHPELALAPESILPDSVRNYAEPRTIEAYRFAAAHPHLLTHQPCYCGCNMIHDSNEACFIQDIAEDGTITFDLHAASCGVCVDIALDVKRMTEAGHSQLEIRHTIDDTYSEVGPSTDTEMPEG